MATKNSTKNSTKNCDKAKNDFALVDKLFNHATRMYALAISMALADDDTRKEMADWAQEWREEMVKLIKPVKASSGYKETWSPFDGIAIVLSRLWEFSKSLSGKKRDAVLDVAEELWTPYGGHTQDYIIERSECEAKKNK